MSCQICGLNASHCECTQATKDAWDLIEQYEKELLETHEGLRRWAYCMWEGMLKACPEEIENMRKFLERHGVRSYSNEA